MRRVISEMQDKSLDFLLIVGDTHINPHDLPLLEGKVYTCAVGRKTTREKYPFGGQME